MSWRVITTVLFTVLIAGGLSCLGGCKKAPPETSAASPKHAAEPTPRKQTRAFSTPNKGPVEPTNVVDQDEDEESPLNYSLALGASTKHHVELSWSDDGTDVTVTATLAGRPQNLGSIQTQHRDLVVRVAAVEACERDADPAPELCVRYHADPLGSTREDPYDAETVFDVTGGRMVRVTPR
jgi:hypothetical protein